MRTLTFGLLAAGLCLTSAMAQDLVPMIQCIDAAGIAHFGYENTTTAPLDVAAGDNNKVTAATAAGPAAAPDVPNGLTTHFLPGYHLFTPLAVGIANADTTVTWSLQGKQVSVKRSVACYTDGRYCWDKNSNGGCDVSEDTNQDGACDIDDCVGPQGVTGPQGSSGAPGAAGPKGSTGNALNPQLFQNTSTNSTATVSCGTGLRLLSGGGVCKSKGGVFDIISSAPDGTTGWTITCATAGQATVYAVCTP